jgi:hypothetical protein
MNVTKLKETTNGTTKNRLTAIGGESPTNGALSTIEFEMPYVVTIGVEGTADILFHRWNCEAVEAKGNAAKGSKAKKTDDIESYVYRDDEGTICIPGEYLRGAIVTAAKYRQDPRSPRKSAMDLFKAGVVCLTPIASTGAKDWHYIDRRRVTIQRNAVTRQRPALRAGWRAEFDMQIMLPEYIAPQLLNDVIQAAGRLVGLGDFRPTFGRFQVIRFDAGKV